MDRVGADAKRREERGALASNCNAAAAAWNKAAPSADIRIYQSAKLTS